MKPLENKVLSAIVQIRFPFASEIGSAHIDQILVVATVSSGADSHPDAMLLGAAQVNGSDVNQLLCNGIAGTVYKIKCWAQMTDGRTLTRVQLVKVVP